MTKRTYNAKLLSHIHQGCRKNANSHKILHLMLDYFLANYTAFLEYEPGNPI
uniref:Uncharacterized protein n=1 Tax=Rhizophora mucronata TaxID=61149 RepID=A0A2P2KTR2_RHIMU